MTRARIRGAVARVVHPRPLMIAPALPLPRTTRWVSWLAFVALCNGVGLLSSLASDEATVYAQLAKPSWAPPTWLFAPVWVTLYTLMGTATYLIWSYTGGSLRSRALGIFGVQLALNALWTPIFFGLQQFGLALFVILVYWLGVAATVSVYGLLVPLAGWLVVPLWLWVTFATALNAAIWWLAR